MSQPTPNFKITGDLIDKISKNLDTALKSSINKIPEVLFVQNFLPYFLGEQADTEELNIAATWAGIAGNPYMPVDVVNDTGEVIYRVPALYERSAIDISRKDARAAPLHHAIITMKQMAESSPKMADNYISQQLSLRNMIRTSPEFRENIDQWNKIFAYYNKPLITLSLDGKASKIMSEEEKKKADSGDAPELVYD